MNHPSSAEIFMKDQEAKLSKFDADLDSAREVSRKAIYQIIVLSSAIVGFSVSLFSIPVLQTRLDIELLKWSWYFFVGTIILGFFILLWEGRIRYALTWKGFQRGLPPDKPGFRIKFYASL